MVRLKPNQEIRAKIGELGLKKKEVATWLGYDNERDFDKMMKREQPESEKHYILGKLVTLQQLKDSK